MSGPLTRVLFICLAFTGLSGCGGGGGSSSGSTGAVVPPPPPPPPPSTEFTVRGVAFKGLLQGANVYVYSADELFDDNPVAIGSSSTSSATGNFSVIVDTAGKTIGDDIVVAVVMKNAMMECDAPRGCSSGIDFGDDFELPKEEIANESRLGDPFFMAAVLPTPTVGTRRDMTVNIFTHMQTVYYNSLLSSTSFPNESELFSRAQTRVANIFGLTDQNFSELGFLDITGSLNADVSSNTMRAAFLSGGIQGAIGESSVSIDRVYFDFLSDFVNQDGEMLLNEGTRDRTDRVSLQDIYDNAIAIEDVNSSSSNLFGNVLQSLKDDKVRIDAAPSFSQTQNGGF
ncbi:MAG: hypothetical protein ABJN69_16315 [Hellea sp.]